VLGLGLSGQLGPPAREVVARSIKAEQAGWDGLWWPDAQLGYHPAAPESPRPHAIYDSFPMMAAAATCTSSIGLGIAVTDPFRRHPALLAQTAQTLHDLSGGRFVLGLGLGAVENLEPFGIQGSPRIADLEEAIDVLRLLWSTADPVSFEGRLWKLRDAVLGVGQSSLGPPRLWLGGAGPRACDLAGRKSDGWIPVMLPVEEYARKLRDVRAAAARAGRQESDVVAGCLFLTVAAADDGTAEALVDSPWVRGVALSQDASSYAFLGARHPLGESSSGMRRFVPTRYTLEEYRALVARIPPPVVKELVLWGGAQRLGACLRDYQAAGLEYAVLWNVTGMAGASPQQVRESFRTLGEVRDLLR
jgi:phthiodiolone/phenolphthiodiolone dimycocerosates ketoreductase